MKDDELERLLLEGRLALALIRERVSRADSGIAEVWRVVWRLGIPPDVAATVIHDVGFTKAELLDSLEVANQREMLASFPSKTEH